MPIIREKREINSVFTTENTEQKTIDQAVSIQGTSLFSGKEVSMRFIPQKAGSGVAFRRMDLPGKPLIEAVISNLKATPRCTILGKEAVTIQCVEHVLSAIASYGIDNLLIEINGGEPPIMDGSAKAFVEMIEKAGVKILEETKERLFLQKPLCLSDGDMDIVALPSKELKYSYTLSYPGHPLLEAQFYSFTPSISCFGSDIAPCRTFALKKEVDYLVEKGIIKNKSSESGVIVDGNGVLNKEGLRFQNEMARHKVLDMIGDLSLVGYCVVAHYIAVKSGHYLNTLMAAKLKELILEEKEL